MSEEKFARKRIQETLEERILQYIAEEILWETFLGGNICPK